MSTYLLIYDPTGADHAAFTVPQGKRVYLSRAAQVAAGTATVQDATGGLNYVLADEVTLCDTGIEPGSDVQLAFVARSDSSILSLLVEVISPRTGVPACG